MARSSYSSKTPYVPKEREDWEPKVDKNPFYRTNDILNGVFKRKMKLDKGKFSKTDCTQNIWVNFNEKAFRKVTAVIFENEGIKTQYMLDCGHEWSGKNKMEIGKTLCCSKCGGEGAYLSFEHEWTHVYFKSAPMVLQQFLEEYFDREIKGKYDVDRTAAIQFMFLFFNGLEDIRVNSLAEKVYAGSAHRLWERWRRAVEHMDLDKNFLAYTMAVGLRMDTDPQSQWANLRPIIEWAMEKVRYVGPAKAMIVGKAALEKCLGAILADVPPPPPKMPTAPPQPSQGNNSGAGQQPPSGQNGDPGDDDGNGDQQGDGADAGAPGDPDQQAGPEEVGGSPPPVGEAPPEADQAPGDGADQEEPVAPPSHIPSASEVRADPKERTAALEKLLKGAKPIDTNEEHHKPTPEEIKNDPASTATKAMVGKILSSDSTDLDALDAEIGVELDQDMQQAMTTLINGMASPNKDSMLTGGAKAKIVLIDVEPQHISGAKVVLSSAESFGVQRMRAAFFKALGKQRVQTGDAGSSIDPEKAIQSLIAPAGTETDIFPAELRNQGFCYHVLTDMSGSMSGAFTQVCHAVEMLKQALAFPFVTGDLWGFRGGGGWSDPASAGEVWLYRYNKRCRGYTGQREIYLGGKRQQVEIACGGITPMNSAINVAVRHLMRQPADMAKRLFLLTDGAPCQQKVTGGGIPEFLLRQFVKDEIIYARTKGIQVYTLLLGYTGLSSETSRYMFGPQQFWRTVTNQGDQTIDRVLATLVIDNFKKYLRARE